MFRNRGGYLKLLQRHLPFLVYGVLSLAVLWQLLMSGHILTLDSTQLFNPDPVKRFLGLDQGVTTTSAGVLFDFINYFFTKILSSSIFEKSILFLIFFLAGLGAHRLISSSKVGAYFTGILYTINPFTYTRFLAGQWGVLWAYAITPFAIKAFIDQLQEPNINNSIKVALLSTLVGSLQLHGFFLLILAFIVLFLVNLICDQKTMPRRLKVCKFVGISAGLFFLVNIFWLVPLVTANDTLLSQIGNADLLFFAPKPQSVFGISFDIASMYGFWRGGYIYAPDLLPFWWVLFVFILFLVVFGILSYLKNKRYTWILISLVVTGLLSFVLALGMASRFSSPVFDWLWNHVPFFRGFRDSQKFVALICLSCACLGGLGINAFAVVLKQNKLKLQKIGMGVLIAVALLTPLIYSFTIFGFYQQIKVTDYPTEWSEVNDYLNSDKSDFNVLFLPWHQYMDYSWSPNNDKKIANPAYQLFDKPLVIGDNMESGGIYSQSTNPISKYIEVLLTKSGNVDNFGELLAPLNVKYIILVNEADYQSYEFIYHQNDLIVALEKPGITVLQNQHFTARSYAVNSVVHVHTLDEYLKLSQTQDVMEHIYVIGDGQDSGNVISAESLEVIQNNPVNYRLGNTSQKYTVFTMPQNVSTDNWEYNGQKPVMSNLGFMPVFDSAEDGGELVYTRFYRVYLPCYMISGLTFLLILGLVYNQQLMKIGRKFSKTLFKG